MHVNAKTLRRVNNNIERCDEGRSAYDVRNQHSDQGHEVIRTGQK